MTSKELNIIYDSIIDYNIATAEEISLVTTITGWNKESLNDIIMVRTGYHNIEQYKEMEEVNWSECLKQK